MPDVKKYEKILDALQHLLEERTIQNISVSDIAKEADMGKGSIYYYFPSKEAILDALIQRNYEKPLKTAKNLANQHRSIQPAAARPLQPGQMAGGHPSSDPVFCLYA